MKLLSEVEKDVMELSAEDRWKLYEKLAHEIDVPPGLPSPEETEQIIQRRTQELLNDPASRMTFQEFRESMGWTDKPDA